MKNIWKRIQGDPVFMQKFHGWQTLVWLALIPVANVTGMVASTAFVSNLSIVALALAALSAWQATRVEVAQTHAAEEMVDTITEKTTVDKL